MAMATCPECRSSNVRAVRDIDGSLHCYNCGYKNEILKLAEENQKTVDKCSKFLLLEIGTTTGEKFYNFKSGENKEFANYSKSVFEGNMISKLEKDIANDTFIYVAAGWVASNGVESGKLVGEMKLRTNFVMSIRKVDCRRSYGEKY